MARVSYLWERIGSWLLPYVVIRVRAPPGNRRAGRLQGNESSNLNKGGVVADAECPSRAASRDVGVGVKRSVA